MKTILTRFGQVEYNPDEILHFPHGMIGFENLHDFIVMPNQKAGPLFWIQSIDDPAIAFVLTDPTNFFLDYQIVPSNQEKEALGMDKDDACYVLSVVTVPPSREITLNLAAPILFAPRSNRAVQVILDDPRYETKTPLPAV